LFGSDGVEAASEAAGMGEGLLKQGAEFPCGVAVRGTICGEPALENIGHHPRAGELLAEIVVEVLAGAIVGTHLAFEASSFLDDKGGPPRTGQLIIAIDPAGFGHGAFAERMATLAKAIESQPGARLSGMRRMALRKKAALEGLLFPAALLQQISAV
jgi:LDH2 family malate/lactate/ureidoglycolate dehydrogenase